MGKTREDYRRVVQKAVVEQLTTLMILATGEKLSDQGLVILHKLVAQLSEGEDSILSVVRCGLRRRERRTLFHRLGVIHRQRIAPLSLEQEEFALLMARYPCNLRMWILSRLKTRFDPPILTLPELASQPRDLMAKHMGLKSMKALDALIASVDLAWGIAPDEVHRRRLLQRPTSR
ncbi:hypothetical protein EXS71_03675 [Candidatus Uhrbacteria bacterium]|nr:hypothetical protein [Candidatus Uhrbacteria bacterium]